MLIKLKMCSIFGKAADAIVLIWFLPLDEAIASRVIFVIVSGSGGQTETLFQLFHLAAVLMTVIDNITFFLLRCCNVLQKV